MLSLLLLTTLAAAEEPLPEAGHSTIGYETVAEALAALRAKPGVQVTEQPDGWIVVIDGRAVWSFPPDGHAAYPSAVRREAVERDGQVFIDMSVHCEAEKVPCDQLVREFTKMNEEVGKQARNPDTATADPNPRDPEAEAFATHWLDLLEQGEADKAYGFLTDIFKSHVTIERWRELLAETEQRLGALQSRKLRRIVWYQDPPNAPLPGTYVAVEFDSVYANAPKHFRFVILHAQGDEPFRVMRDESTVGEMPASGS